MLPFEEAALCQIFKEKEYKLHKTLLHDSCKWKHQVITLSNHISSIQKVQMNTIFVFHIKHQHRFEILNIYSCPALVFLLAISYAIFFFNFFLQNIEKYNKKLTKLEGALSCLRELWATENPLEMMKMFFIPP